MNSRINPDKARIADFCKRWKVTDLSFFGSVLRDDFRPDSDVDVLIEFSQDAEWSLLDHAAMQDELADILGRRVDLVTRRAIERSSNRLRRDDILGTAEKVYVAR